MEVGTYFLLVIKVIIQVYDILTGWIYTLCSSPGVRVRAYSRTRAVPTRPLREGDTQVTYKSVNVKGSPLVQIFDNAKLGTMAEMWSWAVKRYDTRRCFGTRDILGEDDPTLSNGKLVSKLELGDYK